MNKLLGLFLLALACWAPSAADAANCFWVGGTGSINDTTKWSSSSGGAGSTCAATGGWPNSNADNGTFDGSSGGGTITRNVAWTIGTLNIAAFTGTFGNTTDSAAVQLDTFTNNGSGTRTYNMGTSTWTCGRSGVNCVWQISGHSNLTLVASTSTLVLTGGATSGSPLCWFGSGLSYNNVTFDPSSVAVGSRTYFTCNTGAVTIANLTIGSPNNIQLTGNQTWTITGTLSFSGGTPSNSALIYMISSTTTSAQLTLSGGPATCSWCAFYAITAATNSITATNSFDLGRNTNISITPPSGGGGGGRIIGG